MGNWDVMNPPQETDGRAYTDFFNGEMYLVCPFCGKKQLKIKEDTRISNLELKCKASYCKKVFEVDV